LAQRQDSDGGYYGFFLSEDSYTPLEAPRSFITDVNGISSSGEIVGYVEEPTVRNPRLSANEKSQRMNRC
jgi:hypothetical protein